MAEEHHLYARIPEELYQRLKALAALHKRSVTSEVELALERYAAAHAAELAEAPPAPKRSAGRGKRE
jgi:hypothetical protein